MRRNQRNQGLMHRVVIAALLLTAYGIQVRSASAQPEDAMGFVESPVELEAEEALEASAAYPDNFRAAEQALSVGLSRGGNGAKVKHSFPAPTQIKESVNPQPAAQQPTIKRIKSPESAQVLDSLSDPPPQRISHEISAVLPSKPLSLSAKPASLTLTGQEKSKSVKPSAPPSAQQTERKSSESHPLQDAEKQTREAVLQEKLVASEVRLRDLEGQLRDVKSQLAAAELEITRLSGMSQGNSRARLNLPKPETSATLVDHSASDTAKRVAPPPPPVAERLADTGNDLQVASIAVEKADLRLGPGKNHSALMTLRRGSRLAIEARQGEWYRVFAPNGQRAWIHSSLIRFGAGAENLNDGSSVRMRGFDASLR